MRFGLAALALATAFGCAQNDTYIPPPAAYFLLMPESKSVWAKHIEQGFLAGCDQLEMECKVSRYASAEPKSIVKAALDMGDTKGGPICIVFEKPDPIMQTLDLLSVENRSVITVGADDSNAYRMGHVGPDAKMLASRVAARAQRLNPPARKILYLFSSSPVDLKMLEAGAFRESNKWENYRLRTKTLEEVTAADYAWCDLVVPVGEEALARAIASPAKRIVPTDPTDEALALLKTDRCNIVITNNYFDVGLRASRIAREQFVYGRIEKPILPIAPKEVDVESVKWYMDTRFSVPKVVPSEAPPAPKKGLN